MVIYLDVYVYIWCFFLALRGCTLVTWSIPINRPIDLIDLFIDLLIDLLVNLLVDLLKHQ